jgi:hypothetical protein
MRLTPLSILVVLAGCSDALPCSTCPPLDGVYAVSWAANDGGQPIADGGSCPVEGPRAPTWTLSQRGSQVTTSIEGVNLGGTLYDSYDLVLSGSEGGLSYRVRALVVPEGTSADAGVRLQNGTFTTRTLPVSGDPCEVNESFSAQRTSR